MAALTAPQITSVLRQINEYFSSRNVSVNVNKPDIRAALVAIDAWIDTNGAALNSAIPPPSRANLTANQKSYIFSVIAKIRSEVQ